MILYKFLLFATFIEASGPATAEAVDRHIGEPPGIFEIEDCSKSVKGSLDEALCQLSDPTVCGGLDTAKVTPLKQEKLCHEGCSVHLNKIFQLANTPVPSEPLSAEKRQSLNLLSITLSQYYCKSCLFGCWPLNWYFF
jgi:hypothetical protein